MIRLPHLAVLCALGLALPACAAAPPGAVTDPSSPERGQADPRPAIARVLDDWHDAAARADEERYFAHFAPGGVFLGTDATERWDVGAFRAYAHPFFAKGKAWSFHAVRRTITLGPGGAVAWFDEALDTPNLGPARGSGVLLRGPDGAWRIAQYNLAITVPNERFKDVKQLLDGGGCAGRGP